MLQIRLSLVSLSLLAMLSWQAHAALAPDYRTPAAAGPASGQVVQGPSVKFTWSVANNAAPLSFVICVGKYNKVGLNCKDTAVLRYAGIPGSARSFEPPGGLPDALRDNALLWQITACYAPKDKGGIPACFTSATRDFRVLGWPARPTTEDHLRFQYALLPVTAQTLQAVASVRDYDSLRRLAGTQTCTFVADLSNPRTNSRSRNEAPPAAPPSYKVKLEVLGSVPTPCATGGTSTTSPPSWSGNASWMIVRFVGIPLGSSATGASLIDPTFQTPLVQFETQVSRPPQTFLLGSLVPTPPGPAYARVDYFTLISSATEQKMSGSFGLIGMAGENWILVVFDGTFHMKNLAE